MKTTIYDKPSVMGWRMTQGTYKIVWKVAFSINFKNLSKIQKLILVKMCFKKPLSHVIGIEPGNIQDKFDKNQ